MAITVQPPSGQYPSADRFRAELRFTENDSAGDYNSASAVVSYSATPASGFVNLSKKDNARGSITKLSGPLRSTGTTTFSFTLNKGTTSSTFSATYQGVDRRR